MQAHRGELSGCAGAIAAVPERSNSARAQAPPRHSASRSTRRWRSSMRQPAAVVEHILAGAAVRTEHRGLGAKAIDHVARCQAARIDHAGDVVLMIVIETDRWRGGARCRGRQGFLADAAEPVDLAHGRMVERVDQARDISRWVIFKSRACIAGIAIGFLQAVQGIVGQLGLTHQRAAAVDNLLPGRTVRSAKPFARLQHEVVQFHASIQTRRGAGSKKPGLPFRHYIGAGNICGPEYWLVDLISSVTLEFDVSPFLQHIHITVNCYSSGLTHVTKAKSHPHIWLGRPNNWAYQTLPCH